MAGNAPPPRSARPCLPEIDHRKGRHARDEPAPPRRPGKDCARSAFGWQSLAPVPGWKRGGALPRSRGVDTVPPGRDNHPLRRTQAAVRDTGPRFHSSGGLLQSWRYHELVKRALRLFFALLFLAASLPGLTADAADSHVVVATLTGVIHPI